MAYYRKASYSSTRYEWRGLFHKQHHGPCPVNELLQFSSLEKLNSSTCRSAWHVPWNRSSINAILFFSDNDKEKPHPFHYCTTVPSFNRSGSQNNRDSPAEVVRHNDTLRKCILCTLRWKSISNPIVHLYFFRATSNLFQSCHFVILIDPFQTLWRKRLLLMHNHHTKSSCSLKIKWPTEILYC